MSTETAASVPTTSPETASPKADKFEMPFFEEYLSTIFRPRVIAAAESLTGPLNRAALYRRFCEMYRNHGADGELALSEPRFNKLCARARISFKRSVTIEVPR